MGCRVEIKDQDSVDTISYTHIVRHEKKKGLFSSGKFLFACGCFIYLFFFEENGQTVGLYKGFIFFTNFCIIYNVLPDANYM